MNDGRWIQDALGRYEGPLLLYARRFTGDAERSRDVVQQTFLKLWVAGRGEVEGHLAEWLYTVCRNTALDVRRKEQGMERARLVDGTHPAADAGPVASLEGKEEGEQVRTALALLPARQQEVLRLKFQGGLSYQEISRVTGESIGNVGWLIHVGLKALRARLEGQSIDGKVTS